MMMLQKIKTPLVLGLALLVTPSALPAEAALTSDQNNSNVHKATHPKINEQLSKTDLNKVKMRYGPYGEALATDLNMKVRLFNQRTRNQGQIGLELDLDHDRINFKDPSQILNHDYAESFQNSNKGYLLNIATLEEGKTFAAHFVANTYKFSRGMLLTSILDYI